MSKSPPLHYSSVALGRRLNQVNEVAAGILKQYAGDGLHSLRFATEADTKSL